jgi:hypothetical protein
MRRTLFLLTFFLGLSALALSARAIYLEESPEGSSRPAPIVPPGPPPKPGPANALIEAVRRITVMPGYTYRGLTVFPVEIPHALDATDFDSLDEALDAGTLRLSEKGPGSVPTVIGRNTGKTPVLLLAGEILIGGKQDRILRDDVLLPDHSGRVELPVFCVEHGRWAESGDRGHAEDSTFRSRSSMAALGVRAPAQTGASQEEVWGGVRYYQRQLDVDSDSNDLQTVQDAPQAREALSDYRNAFRERWGPETVGIVVARYGRVIGADIFCNARSFRKHRERLLDSYALDCYIVRSDYDRPGRERPPRADVTDAERFLRQVLRADYDRDDSPGDGHLLRVRGEGLRGTALVRDDAVLHASLYAQERIIVEPMPPIRPMPDDRPMPPDRREPRFER